MTVEAPGVDLFREMQERIVTASCLTRMSHAVLDHRARSPLTEETNPGWQVSAHPFVAAGDDEVSELQAVVQRDMAERLGRVDEAESQFASLSYPLHNLLNRKSDDFDQAIGEFAFAYADQNERDYATMMEAVKAGKIEALVEENLV